MTTSPPPATVSYTHLDVSKRQQLDVSDCYDAVEPLRIQIVEKDVQILQRVCDSETSGFAPGVVRYRANPALAEDQLRQMVDFEITEDGQGIPIDGEKIALSLSLIHI